MWLQASFSILLILTFCQELYSTPKRDKNSLLALCKLPLKRGECRGAFRRWFYNLKSGTCNLFLYGGCRGNGNNFESKSQCEKTCKIT